MAKESNLEKLKKDYEVIREKYSLPMFGEINKEFQIEGICECETEYLIREVRKFVAEKIANYIRFIESLLNPSGVQLFVFSIIKSLNTEDRSKLTEVYKKLAEIQIDLVELDIKFDEQKEADFVKKSLKLWESVQPELLGLVQEVRNKIDNKFEVNNKGYFE
jgi:hypothetical protein